MYDSIINFVLNFIGGKSNKTLTNKNNITNEYYSFDLAYTNKVLPTCSKKLLLKNIYFVNGD